MLKLLFSADSTVDLSPSMLEEYSISVLPLYITRDGKTYRDGIDITAEDIFAYVNAGNPICGTAAVSVGDYETFFAENSGKYDAIIHTTISADFSSCFQNASIAAGDYDNVYCVDSRNLSSGIALVVLEGIRLAKTGASVEEIVAHMKEVTGRVETSFILNTLSYLAKGGRCSSVAALGANLLKLRPCIEVKDGKMSVGKKYRGAYGKCCVDYVRDRLSGREDLDLTRIFITHAHAAPEIVADVDKTIRELAPFGRIDETLAGCTVSSHCGPDCLGILFIRKGN